MPGDDLHALRDRFARALVDVGTGDGRFAYHQATEHPDALVVGIDALDEPMGEVAAKAGRKPARGGRPNLVLVRASVEHLPDELRAFADTVTVVLPWGRLLEGIVRAQPDVVGGVAALCRPGAAVRVVLNGEIWLASTPARYESLPLPTPEYVAEVVAPAFARAGVVVSDARVLSAAEAKALPSTWARRLASGRAHPTFVAFEGVAGGA